MEQLDKSQRAFCEAPVGNIRLLAPAGCGKTLCLLYRCKHLAEQSPTKRQRFLIVTFTRAACEELRSRISEDSTFAGIRDQTEITTLNSWGDRQIKREAFSRKLITSEKYYSTMQNLLQPVWKKHESVRRAIENSDQRIASQAPKGIMRIVDSLKSLGFDHVRHKSFPDFMRHWKELERQELGWRLGELIDQLVKFDVLGEETDGKEPKAQQKEFFITFFIFWIKATERLIDSATFTLEDQKYFAYQYERTSVEQERFLSGAASYDHVFVDEFQDINPLDLALVRAIVERRRATLTIAGDDDQAIFEWRGATPEYILDPGQYFDSIFDTHTLGVNYRSPKNIVEHSQRLIVNNNRRVEKKITAYGSAMANIKILSMSSLSEDLNYVHDLVTSSIAEGTSPSRIALIGRKRSQIIPYQIHFASKDIPFCAAEDLQLFLSDTFERLLCFLTIKEDADRRQRPSKVADGIISLCDFVKRYRVKKIEKAGLRSHLLERRSYSIMSGIEALIEYRGKLKGKNEDGKTSLEMAESVRAFIAAESVSDALLALSDNFKGLQRDFVKAEEDIFYTDPPFAQLAEYARRYGTNYETFIDDIESAKNTLVRLPPLKNDGKGDDLFKNPLHLMTASRAKGREFDKVVLLDVQNEIWPNKNARTEAELEAERRVFYVAFTRAREQVTLLLRDGTDPSQYIEELGLAD